MAEQDRPRGFVSSAKDAFAEPRASEIDGALPVAADDVADAGGAQHLRGRDAGGADAGEHDPDVLGALADHAERVQQRGQHDDRGAVLVVVEDGDVEPLLQPALDLEAARRGDVLQVDPAEPGRDRLDRLDDPVRILRRQADRPGVDPGELLEQHRLPLHHRQRGLRADVAEPQDRGAVGDDGDRVALDGEVPDLLGIVGDRRAHPGDARRVGHREVVAGLQRGLGDHLDLPAQVEEEGAVGGMLDDDARDRPRGRDDALHVGRVAGEDRHVPHLLTARDADEIDRPEQAAGVGDRGGERRERAGVVVELDPQRRAERGGRMQGGVECHAGSVAIRGVGCIRSHADPPCGELPRRGGRLERHDDRAVGGPGGPREAAEIRRQPTVPLVPLADDLLQPGPAVLRHRPVVCLRSHARHRRPLPSILTATRRPDGPPRRDAWVDARSSA
ncbi:MAG: hypothetical protein WD067_10325 [Gaiellaceae bacterium]